MGLDVLGPVAKHDPQQRGPTKLWRNYLHSLTNGLQEPAVVLADLTCLLKGPRPLFVETPKVALDVPNVEIEIASDDVCVLASGMRVTRDKRSRWRITGFRGGDSGNGSEQEYSQSNARTPQPERVNSPQNLIEATTHR